MSNPDTSPKAAAPDALVVSGVSHSFGEKKVLDDVSVTVPRGTFAVLLGLTIEKAKPQAAAGAGDAGGLAGAAETDRGARR